MAIQKEDPGKIQKGHAYRLRTNETAPWMNKKEKLSEGNH
jgi:hypothetical protein